MTTPNDRPWVQSCDPRDPAQTHDLADVVVQMYTTETSTNCICACCVRSMAAELLARRKAMNEPNGRPAA